MVASDQIVRVSSLIVNLVCPSVDCGFSFVRFIMASYVTAEANLYHFSVLGIPSISRFSYRTSSDGTAPKINAEAKYQLCALSAVAKLVTAPPSNNDGRTKPFPPAVSGGEESALRLGLPHNQFHAGATAAFTESIGPAPNPLPLPIFSTSALYRFKVSLADSVNPFCMTFMDLTAVCLLIFMRSKMTTVGAGGYASGYGARTVWQRASVV